MKLASKRNLRKDDGFDRLVSAVFDVSEVQQREEQEALKIAQAFDSSAMRRYVDEGLARQGRAAPPPQHQSNNNNSNNHSNKDEEDDEEDDGEESRPAKRHNPGAASAAAPGSSSSAAAQKSSSAQSRSSNGAPRPPAAADVKSGRAEVLLSRNPNEAQMSDLVLPAVVLPRAAPLSALVFVLQKLTPGAPPVVLSMVPPGSSHPILLQDDKTVGDVQQEFYKKNNVRLHLQYQTKRLAAAMVTTTK